MICKNILITFLNEPNLILWHVVKCFKIQLCIINNSIKHQSFAYTELNDQSVLFQQFYLALSHVLSLGLNVN